MKHYSEIKKIVKEIQEKEKKQKEDNELKIKQEQISKRKNSRFKTTVNNKESKE
jgi:hypothetical protein